MDTGVKERDKAFQGWGERNQYVRLENSQCPWLAEVMTDELVEVKS